LGVAELGIGGLALAQHGPWGAVGVFLGTILIVVGIYERKVRDPKVVIVSAATLAGLALWNFALIGLAAMGKLHLALGGKTLYWAIAQTLGAYATWKTYDTYKMLQEKTNPLVVQEVRAYIDELKAPSDTD
jgi:hypothetical protein